jgi:HD-GYP domain-containing protein (c-di-GMP phosphodiesterase class II)
MSTQLEEKTAATAQATGDAPAAPPPEAGSPLAGATPEEPSSSEQWARMLDSLHQLLTGEKEPASWGSRIDQLAKELTALVEHDPDRAVYLAFRQAGHGGFERYSARHAMQCAVVCRILAGRLSWSGEQARSLVNAALTMNIAMTDLQAVLAAQSAPPRPEQRAAIRRHPADGAAMLRAAGIRDETWLQIVQQHHQRADGSGYPDGTQSISPLADALRKVDEFTAKLNARASRPPLSSRTAARKIFGDSANDPVAAAIIKELGIYMPGVLVRLASGHTAVVVRRGAKVHTPLVACLLNRNGSYLAAPLFCDTAEKRFAVVGEANITVRVNDDEVFPPPASAAPDAG